MQLPGSDNYERSCQSKVVHCIKESGRRRQTGKSGLLFPRRRRAEFVGGGRRAGGAGKPDVRIHPTIECAVGIHVNIYARATKRRAINDDDDTPLNIHACMHAYELYAQRIAIQVQLAIATFCSEQTYIPRKKLTPFGSVDREIIPYS